MRQTIVLAMKDLNVLFRIKPALFFAIGWPVCIAVLFGLMFGGSSESRKLPIAVVDEDGTATSKAFVATLAARQGIDAQQTTRAEATDLVRHGKRAAAVILPAGYGAARERLFYGAAPKLELLTDPSRQAESSMLEGLLYAQSAEAMQQVLSDATAGRKSVHDAQAVLNGPGAATVPDRGALQRFLGELDAYLATREAHAASAGPAGDDAAASSRPSWKPVDVTRREVTADHDGPRSSYEITFVQGLVWGLIGCSMSFAISLVTERTRGTLVRLRVAPLTPAQVLGGKALACFIALLLMQTLLLALGVLSFGIRIDRPLALIGVVLCASLAFVGIMMLIASLGKNEQSTSGAGWAILMPMSLFGGGMVPLMAMPAWMAPISNFSPIKWVVLAIEGAIWRGFAAADFLLPCAILLGVGLAGFLLGTAQLQRASVDA